MILPRSDLPAGATQNSIRVAQVISEPTGRWGYFLSSLSSFFDDLSLSLSHFAQWMLQTPGATSYIGCIGKDKFGQEMHKSSTASGVNVCKNTLPLKICFE